MEVQNPDDFLVDLLDRASGVVCAAVKRQRVKWAPLSRPKMPNFYLLLGDLSASSGMYLGGGSVAQRLVGPLGVVEPEIRRQSPLQCRFQTPRPRCRCELHSLVAVEYLRPTTSQGRASLGAVLTPLSKMSAAPSSSFFFPSWMRVGWTAKCAATSLIVLSPRIAARAT
jgi:hypothetical protein